MEAIKSLQSAAARFAQSEVLAESAVQFIAAELGTAPDYAKWEETRKAFTVAYAEARKCDEDSAGKAWRRLADRMKAAYGVEKPKAPTADATRKSDERKATAAKVAEIVEAAGGSVAKIKAAIKALPADASAETVKLYSDALQAADKAVQAKAKASAKEAREALRKRLADMDADQLAALARCADLIMAGKRPTFK